MCTYCKQIGNLWQLLGSYTIYRAFLSLRCVASGHFPRTRHHTVAGRSARAAKCFGCKVFLVFALSVCTTPAPGPRAVVMLTCARPTCRGPCCMSMSDPNHRMRSSMLSTARWLQLLTLLAITSTTAAEGFTGSFFSGQGTEGSGSFLALLDVARRQW